MTNKIEITQPYRAPSSEKKDKPERKQNASSSKWQEVSERKESPKYGFVKNQKQPSQKKPLGSKEREGKKSEFKELSPFDLFRHGQSKPVTDREAEVDFVSLEEDEVEITIENEEKEEETQTLVVIAPILHAAPVSDGPAFNTSYATAASPIASSTFQNIKLLEFAEKLVKKITVMKLSGKTEITLTLKNVTIFNGGIVKVVEHDSARGQYNVIFSNLNPKAHALITSNYAAQMLKESSESKGIIFHMITATTDVEPITSFAADSKDENRQTSDDSSHNEEESGETA